MNKRQKEVIKAVLESEGKVMTELEQHYTRALADVKKRIRELQSGTLTQSKAYRLEFQKQLEKQISGTLDMLQGKCFGSTAEYLRTVYGDGYIGTLYDIQGRGIPLAMPIDDRQVAMITSRTGDDFKLSDKRGINTNELKAAIKGEITRGLITQSPYDEIAKRIAEYGLADLKRAKLIVRTEGHRIQNAASFECMKSAKQRGCDSVKQWDSTLDGNTRPEHTELDGAIAELDEKFKVGKYEGLYPGDFGDPYMDCNCRCTFVAKPRWALSAAQTKRLGNVAELSDDELKPIADKLGIDTEYIRRHSGEIVPINAKNYREFKREYNKLWRYEGSRVERRVLNKGVPYESGISAKKGHATSVNTVDLDYIRSKEYHDKFKKITDNAQLNEQIYTQAKAILQHRNGTNMEDMCILEHKKGRIVGTQYTSDEDNIVKYNKKLLHTIENAEPYTLIAIHNHPTNVPPTGSDFVSAGNKQYKMGIVVTHDGRVFSYQVGKEIFRSEYFGKRVDKYKNIGYNENEAILKVLNELSDEYDIKWSEIL